MYVCCRLWCVLWLCGCYDVYAAVVVNVEVMGLASVYDIFTVELFTCFRMFRNICRVQYNED